MRNYELVCIVQPELDETAFKGVVDRVSSWVTEAGGSVDKVEILIVLSMEFSVFAEYRIIIYAKN